MEILLPIVAWALVWVAGIALVAALPHSRGSFTASGEIAWLVGTGYFAGAFLLTVWMRVLSLAGIPLGRGSVGVPLVLLAAAGAWWIRRRADPSFASAWRETFEALRARDLRGGSRALWFALLAWLALRSLPLFLEVATRPLYPWDAWMQWATKARVWFELKAWVPFVNTGCLACRQGCALYRRGANVSVDRPAVAGLVVAGARPLRRCVDEPAVVVRLRRVRDRDLRRAAADRVQPARRARWVLDRGFAAAR